MNQIADAWCWTFEKDNSDFNFFVFQSLQYFFLTSEKSSLMHMMHLNTKMMIDN